MLSQDIAIVLPELVLAIYSMLALLVAVYTGKDGLTQLVTWATAAVMVAVALWVAVAGSGSHIAFGGLFVDDAFARFAKVAILLSGAAILLISEDFMAKRGLARFEYPLLIALASIGMMAMVSAGDLMSLYMGLELQSLALYVVAALDRDSKTSTEAGLKYFVLGALSSGLLLYGASLVYGYAGTTSFAGILTTVQHGVPVGLLFGLVFMLAGLAFKISAAPFHMWTPDVYEGAPTPITAFFATAPKIAAITLQWAQVLAVLSLLSMFVGAVAAIGQKDIKRLMAYSSIAHMGFALMGLASGTAFGVQAMLVYMAIYVTMNLGTFAFILSLEMDGKPVTDITLLNQFSKREPLKALAVLVLMFSLAGVPPMLGFFGKFYVLKAAVDAGMGWLAVAGVIASVIGAFYYLRIVFYMYFGAEQAGAESKMNPVQWLALMGVAVVMLAAVVNFFGLEPAAVAAAAALVG